MRLRLDPWAAEYNTAYQAEFSPLPKELRVDHGVECAAADWQALSPPHTRPLWPELLFLDGRRRTEARVLAEDDRERLAFGVLGCYGVGAVSCCPEGSRRAVYADCWEVRRICALSSGRQMVNFPIETTLSSQYGLLEYTVVSTAENDVDAVLHKLQSEMLAAEERLAARLCGDCANALVIVDGPRPLTSPNRNLIGYVKTIHEVKLGREQLAVVCALEQGERSPLYLVEARGSYYYEWFLRLRDPRPWLYSLAGMVRMQAYAGAEPAATLGHAQHIADWSCAALPRFASAAYQDPRAPQQLLPIRALEAELGRRMGSAEVIRRRITRHLSTLGA
ncbi:MAG: hypothetical protein M3498_18985 [Deinococcota bacterium]|jgi:hypothetical protein|nr:hypothetical protein [Deinococcota bacterium]